MAQAQPHPHENKRRTDASLPAADASWNDEGDFVSRRFQDRYLSRYDRAGEAEHVFLKGNRLPETWHHDPSVCRGKRPFVIGELGFGTGLNFLATWRLWRHAGPAHPARLHVVSIEGYPFRADELAALYREPAWREFGPLCDELLAAWRAPLPGMHRLLFDDGAVTLTLVHAEVVEGLAAWEPAGCVDAWFLDGFAPARNPRMWSPEVLAHVARLSRTGASLATYTVAGTVRRGLQAAGFDVVKEPGHARKRDMVRGTYRGAEAAPAAPPTVPKTTPRGGVEPPWARLARPPAPPAPPAEAHAVVIGAGLAGCCMAEALTRRGVRVTMLERRPEQAAHVGGGAAPAVAGLLMPRLQLQWSVAQRLYLAGNRFAWGTLARLCAAGHEIPHARSGVLILATTPDERTRLARIARDGGFAPELVAWLTAQAASSVARVPLEVPALRVAEAGWVDPEALCRALAAHATVRHGVEAAALERDAASGQWRVFDAAGRVVAAEATWVILANAHEAGRFAQAAWMPQQPVRGQITHLAPTEQSRDLACPLVYGGYVTPPIANHQHVVGATYRHVESAASASHAHALHADEHAENVHNLHRALPQAFAALAPLPPAGDERAWSRIAGRAGLRATTPDRLPLLGPVVERDRFLDVFAYLRHGPTPRSAATAASELPKVPVHPGLFALLGLGSRGLAIAPLAAEWLAAHLHSEPLPLEPDLAAALLPHRFLARALRRREL